MSSSELAVQDKRIMESAVLDANIGTVKTEDAGGVTDYPVLDFDDDALNELTGRIRESLKNSEIKPGGGKGYIFLKRALSYHTKQESRVISISGKLYLKYG